MEETRLKSEEFMESFLKFEKKYDMFQIRISNVRIWHYIRFYIYYDLVNQLHFGTVLLNSASPKVKLNDTRKEIVRRNIMCNQFLMCKKDVLIIPHSRKYKDEGQYYKCIYTDLIDKHLKQSHYILDGKSEEGIYALQKSKNVIYQDVDFFNKICIKKFNYEPVSKSEIAAKIIEPLEEYFKISITIENLKKWYGLMNSYINNRKYLIRYYNFILNRIKPKIILMVVSYSWDRMILCEVAHRKKIPIVELQHGMITGETLPYNFYQTIKLSSFPDYIFTFGQFDKRRARFPIKKENIIPVGYPELETFYKAPKKNQGVKNILFISQGIQEIAEYANFAAEKLDKEWYKVIFQLHPKEYTNWKSNVGYFLKNPNIKIVGSFEHTVYHSLVEADWVIGCYSTVLSEAAMFDAKVVVLKTGLYTNMKELYNNGYALLVESPKQLVEEIENDSFIMNKEISLFEKNSLRNIQFNIDKILNMREGKDV